MAAATVASGYPIHNVVGNKRHVLYKLTAPADTNTVATPLVGIDAVFLTACGSTALAAADSVSVTATSGGTFTLGVIGTARDLWALVIGY